MHSRRDRWLPAAPFAAASPRARGVRGARRAFCHAISCHPIFRRILPLDSCVQPAGYSTPIRGLGLRRMAELAWGDRAGSPPDSGAATSRIWVRTGRANSYQVMTTPIARAVYEAGQKLLAASCSGLVCALNEALNQFVGWPFRAATGIAADSEGNKTHTFGTLIYATPQSQPLADSLSVHADLLGCVIDVSEALDAQQLRSAYERIARAKSLKKAPAPQLPGFPHTTITLGIILGRASTLPIEALAEELDRLNRDHPHHEWTDMVAVLSTGTINYACQFPGEGPSGDFLPPAEGATSSVAAPIYIVMMVKPSGAHAFNRMCGFLIAHLGIFSPGARLPNWAEVVEGTTKQSMVICGYQFNLSGQVVPVPRQFYNDRYIPPRPFRIEDNQGNLLSTLQFLPWQDGGVVLSTGQLPLDGLLVFLGRNALKNAGFVKRPHAQISYVLPIAQADFIELLKRIQRQSNMIVRADPTKFIVQKVADEGTSSPFYARLFLGILRLRDVAFPDPTKRDEFDKAYEFVIMTLPNTRATSQQIVQTLAEHSRRVSCGEIARVHGTRIEIDESIDSELRKHAEAFLNSAVRALKQGMQDVTRVVQVNIGFLFQKADTFEREVAELEKSDPSLAAYLRETRRWSEPLVDCRNAIEHEGWTLPRVKYAENSGAICAEEPQISGQPISEFVKFMMDRLSCFVEEVTAHCLQVQMPAGFSVAEVPLLQREPEAPERFRVTLTHGGMPIWEIVYHQSAFEET